MRFILVLLIVSNSLILKSQSFAPLGAKWTHSISNFWTGEWHVAWTVIKDTIVQNKNCSFIKKSSYKGEGDFSREFICYEDSGVVYLFNPAQNSFSTFIDFNADSGDAWTTVYPYFNNDSCEMETIVDSINSISVNGHTLKRLFVHLQGKYLGPSYIITERFGYSHSLGGPSYGNHGLYPAQHLWLACDGAGSADGDEYAGLKCYEDSIIGFVKLDSTANCPYVGLAEENSTMKFEIIPNPASSFLEIKWRGNNDSDIQYKIVNGLGKEVFSGSLESSTKLDVSSLPSGMYLMYLFGDQRNHTSVFIKK